MLKIYFFFKEKQFHQWNKPLVYQFNKRVSYSSMSGCNKSYRKGTAAKHSTRTE